ncbi:MAG: hypothetical protein KDJ72_02315 [Methyloceanibacter sp.]|uniref:hypothetical protein n=1 Tax=Methyloceanibacter sp. TaxID=1965321 RepID=UPI001D8542B6|nr:hypothetical protein [Methyloceanibacter sp.]MCB1441831.1 hypothetical protein [Methyloceanibacter sp.]
MRVLKLAADATRATLVALIVLAGTVLVVGGSAKASSDTIGVELNKLNPEGNGCQAYFVFDNQSGSEYGELKVDLVVFNSEEVVERRFAMDIAPLEAKKRTVKLFELKEMSCDKIGSLLINGVLECKEGKHTRSDCVDRLVPSSRIDVKLTK